MPYAIDGKISKSPLSGGVEITQEQYKQALGAIMGGGSVAIRSGELKLLSAEKRTVYSTEDGSEHKIPENEDTPEGYTDTEKPSQWHNWDEQSSRWVEDTEAKDAAAAEEARRQGLEDDTEAKALEDILKSKTNAEIDTIWANATAAQKDRYTKAIFKIVARRLS